MCRGKGGKSGVEEDGGRQGRGKRGVGRGTRRGKGGKEERNSESGVFLSRLVSL